MATSSDSSSISLRDAAHRLDVHENTVRRWIDRGILPAEILPSGTRRLRRADVDALSPDAPDVSPKLAELMLEQGTRGLTAAEHAQFDVFESDEEVDAFIALTRAARDRG